MLMSQRQPASVLQQHPNAPSKMTPCTADVTRRWCNRPRQPEHVAHYQLKQARGSSSRNTSPAPKSSSRGWAAGMVAVPAALALLCSAPADVYAADIQGTFSMKCAGCHMNGGNVLAAGATLFPEDLKRNGVADPEAMFNLIYRGKGRMPGYGEGCAPKGQCTFGPRVSDEDIRGLVSYVLERAEAEWK